MYSLIGIDGNAFAVMGYVAKSMRREGFTREEIREYEDNAMSSDYGNLLRVSQDYIDKCNARQDNDND